MFISGFVQGVGFRYFVKDNARKLGITGWTRNTTNNRVEVMLQGNKQNIKQLITLCHKGPFLAEVKEITVEWEETTEQYENFSIEH